MIAGRLVGYARVSTDEQGTDAQADELRAAGCDVIFREHRSGADRDRPELARLLRDLGRGDVLVVVRLDRLARSVSHLLEVIERLTEKGAHFRSLHDPIDTSTPQGMFSLQVLGAVAQLERALIAERTRAGIKAAIARGKKPGNPGLRERRPDAIRKVIAARDHGYVESLVTSVDAWLPTVRMMRPDRSWRDVVRTLNAKGQRWTIDRLQRSVKRMVNEGLADPLLLGRAPPRQQDRRLITLIGGIAGANKDLSLAKIATQLERMRERAPRGGEKWSASSVKNLLDRARARGLLP